MYYVVLAGVAAICFLIGFYYAGYNSTATRLAQYERDLEQRELELDAARKIIEGQRRTIGELEKEKS